MRYKYLLHVPAPRIIKEIVKASDPEALESCGLFFVLVCWVLFVFLLFLFFFFKKAVLWRIAYKDL